MSSSVYFKFKSQKEPTRVTIDGPHIDVWNLKREIITLSRLGDGTDFDLKIYKENSEEEYTDDTELISKDSTVLARRLPASAPGKGRAARYVSGKPPATAKPSAAAKLNAATMLDANMSEEDRIKAMLKMTDAQWQAQQEDMSHDARIGIAGQGKFTKNVKIPEGEPPHGYVCYRCKKKGHWIQACPTNDDASYDGRPRTKRTTGIPQSRLRKVDESEIDNLDESARQNLMVNADGDYVLAQSDEKAWKKFQEQQQAQGEAQKSAKAGNQELQELGLECSIDKRMFVDPMKTPCCGRTYCHECIENALIDNDLQCPGCQTENVSLEGLKPDEDMKKKIREYQDEKKSHASNSVAGSPRPVDSSPAVRSPRSPGSTAGRKRTASDVTNDNDNLAASAMKRQRSGSSVSSNTNANIQPSSMPSNMNMPNPMLPNMMGGMPNMNMPFNPMMNPLMMGMMGMNGMNLPMPNMGMMPNMNNFMPNNFPMNNMMNGGYNNMNGHQPNNFNPRGNMRGNGWKPKNQYPRNNTFSKTTPSVATAVDIPGAPKGPKSMQNGANTPNPGVEGAPTGPSAQQKHQGGDEDSAYMRQPVNPQRAWSRNKGRQGMRAADYREIGS